MRTLTVLLAITMLAGCRVATAPTLAPESMRYGIPGAPTWLRHSYDPNDRFSELADLTYRVVGERVVLEARFVDAPASIGDKWFGDIQLENGGPTWPPEGVTEVLRLRSGQGEPQAWRFTNHVGPTIYPASARIIGPILRLTCDASVLDFHPTIIMFSAMAYPHCDGPNHQCALVATFARALGEHGPVASVDR
jgi:hypothetical protein